MRRTLTPPALLNCGGGEGEERDCEEGDEVNKGGKDVNVPTVESTNETEPTSDDEGGGWIFRTLSWGMNLQDEFIKTIVGKVWGTKTFKWVMEGVMEWTGKGQIE